jgi:MFS family permease
VQVISEGRRWRRLLGQNIQFRRLFLAHSISRAGDAFNTVALLVLIFDLTGSGVGVAGIVALEIVPVLLLGPLVGLTVDRYPHRSLMMVADVARAVLALLVAIGGSVPVAYGVAFGLSAFTQLFNPAASSTLPDVVEADELVEANAALWTVAVVAQTVLGTTGRVAGCDRRSGLGLLPQRGLVLGFGGHTGRLAGRPGARQRPL